MANSLESSRRVSTPLNNDDTSLLERNTTETPSATSKSSPTPPRLENSDLVAMAIDVLEIEGRAVLDLRSRIGEHFISACHLLFNCTGRVVVCGVGKSGHIANKIAATLASTGSPAFFVHPSEASHGDFGMIKSEDIVIAISYSGESEELKLLLPLLKRCGNQIISFTGKPDSSLARAATVNLDISISREACPLGLAPTTSTTATLAMGDALAVAVLKQRGFSATDFAFTHPGGALGKRLLLHVSDVMVIGSDTPIINEDMPLKDALYQMSAGQLGFVIIADTNQKLAGVFSDGDLRRALDRDIDINRTTMADIMTIGGHSVKQTQLAVDALEIMELHKIYALPVLDENDRVCGALNMHSLFQAGVV